MKLKYLPTIGLEVHVELSTASKMFCGCPAAHFGIEPNSQTCPVCLGLPGALPVANEKAIIDSIKIGLALNSKVRRKSKFDRKQYFYPDLPKGYQISQYDEPLCTGGFLETAYGRIGITRVHLEEDTGKLVHAKVKGENVTLVDFNRSGVPLVEIVTEPDINSAKEAKEFAKGLRRLIRWLGVSDCDMEKGSMRLEGNISIRKPGAKLADYKVEVKNINSFRYLEKAIDYEINRQNNLLSKGKKVMQETRGWDEIENKTRAQRSKETESDYRYFPEPDIPPLVLSDAFVNEIKKNQPILPKEYEISFENTYKIPVQYIKQLTEKRELAEYVNKVILLAKKEKINTKVIINKIVNEKINIEKINPKRLIKDIKSDFSSKISSLKIIDDFVDKSISALPKAVKDYKDGKKQALAVLIGEVMKISKGKADAKVAKEILESKLKKTDK